MGRPWAGEEAPPCRLSLPLRCLVSFNPRVHVLNVQKDPTAYRARLDRVGSDRGNLPRPDPLPDRPDAKAQVFRPLRDGIEAFP